jgi:hypothetical protein
MEVRAPKGQYRVIGLDPVDTLTWPSGPLWKDCETFDKALDLAATNDELYLRIYIYNDKGEILHEAGCYREQLKKIHELEEQRPGRAQDERAKT